MEKKGVLLTVLLAIITVAVLVGVVLLYVNGAELYKLNVMNYDEQLREATLDLAEKKREQSNQENLTLDTPVTDYFNNIAHLAEVAAGYQNGDLELTDADKEGLSPSAWESTWYPDALDGKHWSYCGFIGYDPDFPDNVDLVWMLYSPGAVEKYAVAFGRYSSLHGQVFVDHVYFLNSQPDVADTSPFAPDPYTDTGE